MQEENTIQNEHTGEVSVNHEEQSLSNDVVEIVPLVVDDTKEAPAE